MRFWAVRLGSILVAFSGCFLLQSVANGQSSFTRQLLVLACLFVTLSVSLNLINGITGQFSIGHAAFFQIGAYTSAFVGQSLYGKLPMSMVGWHLLVAVIGAAIAGIAGLLVGLPSLRLRGDYLAVVTLGFGEIVRIVVQNQKVLGESGGLNVTPKSTSVWMVAMLAVVCIAVCRNLLKTAHGLTFLAIREDEVASSAMGVNVTRTKVTAFVIGSAFAGAAGAFYANELGFITHDLFRMDVSFIILTMVVLGGSGSITGSVVAAILLFYIPEKMRDITEIRLSFLVAAALMIAAAVALVRQVSAKMHGAAWQRGLANSGIALGAIVLTLILNPLLANVPALAANVEGGKLRLVVFAVTLIVLMLVRPQGIFGHHEFSWAWVQKLLGRRDVPQTEVSSR